MGHRGANEPIVADTSLTPAPINGALLSDERERYYHYLGWWKGPRASPEVREATRRYWLDRGTDGARWLIRRAAGETHLDVLDAVANLLVDLGPDAVQPLLDALGGRPSADLSVTLLQALRWIGPEPFRPRADDLTERLPTYLNAADADVREAAVRGTRALGRVRATPLLRERQRHETSADVLVAIQDELES